MTDEKYYTNDGTEPINENWGNYQFVSLADIINNFILIHTDDEEIFTNVKRTKIIFHAKRCVQELNFDSIKEIRALQLDISNDLRFILPKDYVNYVRISVFKDGVLFPLSQNQSVMTAKEYLQDNNYQILFDSNGEAIETTSQIDKARIEGTEPTICPWTGTLGYFIGGYWYFPFSRGGRFGLDTSDANVNPTFTIDTKMGVINFSSGVKGQSVILEYLSDGLVADDESLIKVNKLAEKYVYAYLKWAIAEGRKDTPDYVVRRYAQTKKAEWNNLKIRINFKPDTLRNALLGQAKWIK